MSVILVASQTTLLHHSKEDTGKKTPLTSRERWKKYEQSPQGKWTKMKKDLRYRMNQKRKRIAQLEEELLQYEQKVSGGNGAS